MTVEEALTAMRYVVNSSGERTDIVIPLTAWETLLASWKQLIEALEDQEDSTILLEWLEKRATGEVDMISLDTLEQELIADGLLPG